MIENGVRFCRGLVSQIDAVSMEVALNQWADTLKFPHIGDISKSVKIVSVKKDDNKTALEKL
ncbi:hypothetical protein [Hoylesella timonensis]|uniref:hypothetical protein n=1 Tax=Hoylesella timonensis TaxID=386414 RepID=UPI0018984FF9|nr:hypothetical protein [Hoylesella timonensis]